MKKNSPISRFLVILHAYTKRGFFAAPLCTVFSLRPVANDWCLAPAAAANSTYGPSTPVRVRR